MKKAVLILVMMFAFMKPVHAQVATPPGFPFAMNGAGSLATGSISGAVTAMSSALFVAWVFPYLNTTGEKPFEDMFTSVDYSYPRDRKPQAAIVHHHPMFKDEFGIHPAE